MTKALSKGWSEKIILFFFSERLFLYSLFPRQLWFTNNYRDTYPIFNGKFRFHREFVSCISLEENPKCATGTADSRRRLSLCRSTVPFINRTHRVSLHVIAARPPIIPRGRAMTSLNDATSLARPTSATDLLFMLFVVGGGWKWYAKRLP